MTDSVRRPSAPVATSPDRSAFFSQRAQRQLGLFAAGAGFFALSTLITRRSLVRRYKLTVPKFFQPNNAENTSINGAMEAFEALNIATVNVLSVGIMATGGFFYAFDISSLDDMRTKVRRQMGVDANRKDQDVEKDIEEWFATVLNRKEKKEKLVEGMKGEGQAEERRKP